MVAELWNATMARAANHSDNRKPVMAYLDEWQNFLKLPTPMSEVLAASRGLGLGMVLAHQHLGQLPTDVQHAVLANARSKVVFQLPAGDARLIARELGGVLTADDLQGLGAYEVAAQLFAAGSTQTVATASTRSGRSADHLGARDSPAVQRRPSGPIEMRSSRPSGNVSRAKPTLPLVAASATEAPDDLLRSISGRVE